MKNRILLIIMFGSAVYSLPLHAQLLTETFSRYDSLSNLSYKMTLKEKDPFSDKIFKDTVEAYFSLSKNKELFKIAGIKVQEIYEGNKLIKMDLYNLTYQMENGIENSILRRKSLPYIISSLKQNIKENIPIKLQKDSVVNGKEYFHIGITELDTIKNGKRVYRIIQVLIDKKSHFPIYYRSDQQGFVDGTDIFVDTYFEIHFFDYQLNTKEIADLSSFVIPPEFDIKKSKEPKSLLANGTKAPELDLTDTTGGSFLLKRQKGKVVLLNFTSSSCPHSIESISMLNALNSKYANRNFTIVTINPYDDKEAIEMYNKTRNINYPIFINNGTHNTDNYNVDSYPTFYLIDKSGYIIKGISGYYKLLDQELNSIIKKHL
jgi:thiol-disulfide isomerase/thioredoxin